MEVNCGELRTTDEDKEVMLNGWCRYVRGHKDKIFIDLADRYGVTQIVFDSDKNKGAGELKREFVVRVHGCVMKREKDTIDKSNPTGEIEVAVDEFSVINRSETPPFELIEEKEKFLANEDIRLKYRYLDLRRKEMVDNIEFRDSVSKLMRKFFWRNGFLELETPTLVRDTYETGSRTFLVPSRTRKGRFYSLPQSPQLYKQLCMVAGLDKYFQVCKAYRDEDAREDRQPEFTQIDMEISFEDEAYVQALIESLFKKIFKEILKKQPPKFHRMSYAEAVKDYGSDKPDLRYGYKIIDFTRELKDCGYNVITRVLQAGGKAKGVAFDAGFGGGKINRKYMLGIVEEAKSLGLKGLTWLFVEEGKLRSAPESIAESLGKAADEIVAKTKAKDGYVIIMGADLSESVLDGVLGKLRKIVGDAIGRFSEEYAFVWVDEFPLFEQDEVTGKLKPSHNPFTAPMDNHIKMLETSPHTVLSRQFDLVLNGNEIGGGAVRINSDELQRKIFKIINVSERSVEKDFGFLLEALKYGAPEDVGFALGFDRVLAVLKHNDNIRDFILFPKTKTFESPIDGSPSEISEKRLKDDYGLKKTLE
jgi:aspartyl-tRNA synthetase